MRFFLPTLVLWVAYWSALSTALLFFSSPILYFSMPDLFCNLLFSVSFLPRLLSSSLSLFSHPSRFWLYSLLIYTDKKSDALTRHSCFTKAGNINTHFFPIDRNGTSIFSPAYNIPVSAGYNAPLLITIRPNNNITEPGKHTRTWPHKQYTIDRLLCFTEQTHRENCNWNYSENGSNTHRKRERGLRKTDNLFLAPSKWPILILQALCGISSHWGSCWPYLCANDHCLCHGPTVGLALQ